MSYKNIVFSGDIFNKKIDKLIYFIVKNIYIMSNIGDQLNEMRQKKHQEYLKRLELEEFEEKKLEKERIEKNRLEDLEIKEYQDKLYQEELEALRQKKLEEYEETLLKKPDNYNPEQVDINIPFQHREYIDYSYSVIISLFDEDNNEGRNMDEFVKNYILYYFYEKIQNTNIDDLYIFYVSIKEICSTYETTNIELVVNTIKLINMNDYFIDVIRKSDRIDNIKIIFQEFIKLIDNIRPELSM